MRFLLLLIIASTVFLSCTENESPSSEPPESVQLVFPERNSECNTGRDINTTASEVEFRWEAANNTDTYELIVTNLNNDNKQDITVTTTRARLPILKGTPYSWTVISRNSEVLASASSASWNFYNSGYQTTYAPFPAEIQAPEMGATVFKDGNDEVELSWTGADVDNDIDGYEVYFSTENPPETLIFSPGPNASIQNVTVAENIVYYWRIVTIDEEGNTSDSGVFEFRAR